MPINSIQLPKNIKIIFFDMDHTLINNDCDLSWKIFLHKKGIVGLLDKLQGQWHFWMYRLNRLNQKRFFKFQFRQFQGKTPKEMEELLNEHFISFVKSQIYPGVIDYLKKLKKSRIQRILLTATCEDIAKPLAKHLGMDGLIGTKLELKEDKYTGQIQPPWCGGENKIRAIESYINKKKISLIDTSYWGDNVSDIVVLKKVGFPVACNPTAPLKKAAEENNWLILKL